MGSLYERSQADAFESAALHFGQEARAAERRRQAWTPDVNDVVRIIASGDIARVTATIDDGERVTDVELRTLVTGDNLGLPVSAIEPTA